MKSSKNLFLFRKLNLCFVQKALSQRVKYFDIKKPSSHFYYQKLSAFTSSQAPSSTLADLQWNFFPDKGWFSAITQELLTKFW